MRSDILCKLHVETDNCTYVIFDTLEYYVILDTWERDFSGLDKSCTPFNPNGPYYKFKIENEEDKENLYFFSTGKGATWNLCDTHDTGISEIISGINSAIVEKYLFKIEE